MNHLSTILHIRYIITLHCITQSYHGLDKEFSMHRLTAGKGHPELLNSYYTHNSDSIYWWRRIK